MAMANKIDVFAGRPYALVQLICTAWAHGLTLHGPVEAPKSQYIGYMTLITLRGHERPQSFWAKSEETCCNKALAWLALRGYPTVSPPAPPVVEMAS